MTVVLEVSVLKKQKEMDIQAMKDKCATTYGGTCNTRTYCPLCLIKDDVREITRLFESSEDKMHFGKKNALKAYVKFM